MTPINVSRLISLCAILLAILAAPVAAGPDAAEVTAEVEAPTPYVDEDNGFSILPPQEWEASFDTPGTVVTFMSPQEDDADAVRENFNIAVLAIDELPAPEALADEVFDSVRGTFEDLELLSAEEVTLNGMPADRIEYKCTFQQLRLRMVQYLVLTDGADYVLTFSAHDEAYDAYRETFEAAFETFTALDEVAVDDDADDTPAVHVDEFGMPEEVADEEPVVYVNEAYNLQVTPPAGWEIDESDTDMIVVFMSTPTGDDDNFGENINMLTAVADELPDPAEYGQAILDNLGAAFENTQLIAADSLMIGDRPAIRVEYGYTAMELDLQASQHIILADDIVYIITCTALDDTFEAYKEDFEASVGSIVIADDE